jgi:hypothetical protein
MSIKGRKYGTMPDLRRCVYPDLGRYLTGPRPHSLLFGESDVPMSVTLDNLWIVPLTDRDEVTIDE